MTPSDYLNRERFPLTSQEDLSLDGQLRIDAFNWDQLREAVENGYQMDDRKKKVYAELKEKAEHAAEVIEQAQAAGLM